MATQALVEPAYGPRGLKSMRAGAAASTALHELLAEDPGEAVRQVAMVDRHGRVAVHTGARTIAHAGHQLGDGVSFQANMMRDPGVPEAMLDAWRQSGAPLAECMLAALQAAEAAGGDVRGRQSAALLVVAAEAGGEPLRDRAVDLRVDDHPDPLAELRRQRGEELAEAGDHDGALREFDAAAALAPGNAEMEFWRAVALTVLERGDEARPLLDRLFAENDGWRELYERLPDAGLLPTERPRERGAG